MGTAYQALDRWLSGHPYLAEIGRFQRSIDEALGRHEPAGFPIPRWDDFAESIKEGKPLLASMPLDKALLAHAGVLLAGSVNRIRETDNPEKVKEACARISDEFRQSPDAAAMLLGHIAAGQAEGLEQFTRVNPGFARFISWRALETVLRPWVENFMQWFSDASWGRPYCPFCGSQPAMGQLVRTKKGRERFLSCGCCRSRWSYQRTRCFFCGNQDQEKLEILQLEEEDHFRIDVCRECNGYLKTYTGEGDESLLLADWSTLHIDILARKEGLQRRADSLYEL